MLPLERHTSRLPLTGPIELVLPADSDMVRLARLVASGVATFAGFDVTEVDDLRIAVDEGCAALIEAGDGRSLGLSFSLGPASVEVVGSTEAGTSTVDALRSSLSERILGVVADEHEFATHHGRASFRLCKWSSTLAASSDEG
jgi:serine/threonine-protein kinase RsbW